MKKLLYFMLISIVSFMGYRTAYSTCPEGYSQTTVTLTLISGCDYYVDLCYKCAATGTPEIFIQGFAKVDPNCVDERNPTIIGNEIESIVVTRDFYMNILCPEDPIPPCDEEPWGIYITYNWPMCWQKENIGGIINYVTCVGSSAMCYELWKLCKNPDTGEEIFLLVGGPEGSGQNLCPDEEISVPDPPLGETSGCFHLHTHCNPN